MELLKMTFKILYFVLVYSIVYMFMAMYGSFHGLALTATTFVTSILIVYVSFEGIYKFFKNSALVLDVKKIDDESTDKPSEGTDAKKTESKDSGTTNTTTTVQFNASDATDNTAEATTEGMTGIAELWRTVTDDNSTPPHMRVQLNRMDPVDYVKAEKKSATMMQTENFTGFSGFGSSQLDNCSEA